MTALVDSAAKHSDIIKGGKVGGGGVLDAYALKKLCRGLGIALKDSDPDEQDLGAKIEVL